MKLILIILLALILSGVIFTFIVSYIIYTKLLVRTSPDKWTELCSFPDEEEYVKIIDDAVCWKEAHISSMRDVYISTEGLRLHGEYYDFGYKRAVIIISGRTETCTYSCHFAEPYYKLGYNVLTIDNRAHGLSEGDRSYLGFKEYHDILAWARFLHEEAGAESIVLHGICIGSQTALFTLLDKDCPSYIEAMTADGMFATFKASFDEHMVVLKHPKFPFVLEVMAWIRLLSKANVVTDGPIYRIDKLEKPILFLHSRLDEFSLAEKTEIIYGKCKAKKQIVWFDKGSHSRIRINNTEKYERAIGDFYCKL